MAQTTTSALQSAIDSLIGHDAGTMSPVRVLQEAHDSATYSRWYVAGNYSPVGATQTIRGPRALWAKTTVSGNAAAQALEVLTAMGLNSNIDPDAEV